MSNQWLRLWHDMPTDPKWRTIARASKQRIGDVMAVYMHILVSASTATERGRTQSLNCEDVASALDMETSDVTAIVAAMQSRVLDGDVVLGWEKRQPAREDGSAERSKAWREEKKAQKAAIQTQPNEDQTHANAAERKRPLDKDTDKEEIKKEEKRTATRASRLPADFQPDLEFAREQGIADPDREAAQFSDFWSAKPGRDGTKLDWPATWRTWCRNSRAKHPAQGIAMPARGAAANETYRERDSRQARERVAAFSPLVAARDPSDIFTLPEHPDAIAQSR